MHFNMRVRARLASLRRIAAGEHDATDAHARSVMFQPMCWPNPGVVNDSLNYNAYDDESRHRSQTALFEGIVAQVAGQLARDATVRDTSPLVAGALPVDAAMRRVGFEAAVVRAVEDLGHISSLVSSLHASAHSIIDGALANDDVRNVDGIVARLSTFVELSVIKSVTQNDEVVGIMNALALVREHPYGASPRADDLVLRALVAKGVAHKTKTEIHVQRSTEAVGVGAALSVCNSPCGEALIKLRARALPRYTRAWTSSACSWARALRSRMRTCVFSASIESPSYSSVVEFQNWRLRVRGSSQNHQRCIFEDRPNDGSQPLRSSMSWNPSPW